MPCTIRPIVRVEYDNRERVAKVAGSAQNTTGIAAIWTYLEKMFDSEKAAINYLKLIAGQVTYNQFLDLKDYSFYKTLTANTLAQAITDASAAKNQSAVIESYYKDMNGLPADHMSGTEYNPTNDSNGIRIGTFYNGTVVVRNGVQRNAILPLNGTIREWYKPQSVNKRFFTKQGVNRVFYTMNGTHVQSTYAEWYERTPEGRWIRID